MRRLNISFDHEESDIRHTLLVDGEQLIRPGTCPSKGQVMEAMMVLEAENTSDGDFSYATLAQNLLRRSRKEGQTLAMEIFIIGHVLGENNDAFRRAATTALMRPDNPVSSVSAFCEGAARDAAQVYLRQQTALGAANVVLQDKAKDFGAAIAVLTLGAVLASFGNKERMVEDSLHALSAAVTSSKKKEEIKKQLKQGPAKLPRDIFPN